MSRITVLERDNLKAPRENGAWNRESDGVVAVRKAEQERSVKPRCSLGAEFRTYNPGTGVRFPSPGSPLLVPSSPDVRGKPRAVGFFGSPLSG